MGEHHHGVSTSTMPAAAHGGARTTTTTPPPKIRIIHIIAPEIIKTDVANFRDLVQRLTGKPASCAITTPDDMAAAAAPPPVQEEAANKKRPPPAGEEEPSKKRKIKCEVKVEEGGFGDCDLLSFLSFLEEQEEEDDVFRGMMMAPPDHDFLQPFGSSRMDLVGEMYAS